MEHYNETQTERGTQGEERTLWDSELGYETSNIEDVYPRRVTSAKSNLEIIFMSFNEEIQDLCWPNAKGYKVFK